MIKIKISFGSQKANISHSDAKTTAIDMLEYFRKCTSTNTSKVSEVKEIIIWLCDKQYTFNHVEDADKFLSGAAEIEAENTNFRISVYNGEGIFTHHQEGQLKHIYQEYELKFMEWVEREDLSFRLQTRTGENVRHGLHEIIDWVCKALGKPNIFMELPRKVVYPEKVQVESEPKNTDMKVELNVTQIVDEIQTLSSTPGNEARIHELSTVLKYVLKQRTPIEEHQEERNEKNKE